MTDSEQATQASLQDLYMGARRDATYWNERWHASHFEHAAERERLEARLAASEAEVAGLKKDRCEHCGAQAVKSYRSGCPGCGAPICCERCCDEDNLQRERDSLRDKLAKLAEYAVHLPGCARTRLRDSFIDSIRQPCTCGLAALQSSEKG